MDILKAWKFQRGRGTYLSIDSKDDIKVVSYLISSISKMNSNIRCFAPESKVGKYAKELNIDVSSYDSGVLPNDAVFLLILLDVDFVPTDILNILVNANPHKYLFCTASLEGDLGRSHLSLAPIIRAAEPTPKERKITMSDRVIYNIALDLSTDDQKIYDTYTEKMNDLFDFFGGDFNTINGCYKGDHVKGITADVFRRDFAHRNSWSDQLDTSIEYYKEIDSHYNPNSIYEKAKLYFEILANRNHFLDEHSEKSYFAHKLISYHNDKRYLIVCKNSYMADKVHNLLHNNNKCKSRAIHNDLDPVNFNDDTGELIRYKSGNRKGQPKDFGSKLQTDAYTTWFNNKQINVLICTNSVRKELILKSVDVIVYLSPRCMSYEELQQRIKIKLNSNVNIVNIYFAGTKDDDAIFKAYKSSKHTPKYYYKGDIGKLKFD